MVQHTFPRSYLLAYHSGKQLLCLEHHTMLKLYSTQTGELISTWPSFRDYRLWFSPGGRYILAVSATGVIKWVDVTCPSAPPQTLNIHEQTEGWHYFENDHSVLVSTYGGRVYRLDLNTKSKDVVYSCEFAGDHQWINGIHRWGEYWIFACFGGRGRPDHLLVFRHGFTGKPVKLFFPLKEFITSISFLGDRFAVISARQQTLSVYQLLFDQDLPQMQLICQRELLDPWQCGLRVVAMKTNKIMEWLYRLCGQPGTVRVYDDGLNHILFDETFADMERVFLTDDDQVVLSYGKQTVLRQIPPLPDAVTGLTE